MSLAATVHIFILLAVCIHISCGAGELLNGVAALVRRWAPLVWLAPGERFMPLSVDVFLQHVIPIRAGERVPDQGAPAQSYPAQGDHSEEEGTGFVSASSLPRGPQSLGWFLVSKNSIESLLENRSSFLFGQEPRNEAVPVYALVSRCDGRFDRTTSDIDDDNTINSVQPDIIVTYWFFFPYNEGKPLCTLNLGPLGPWPLPLLWGVCLGSWTQFGGHVGDWEHVSIMFRGSESVPSALYVSAHEAGAFYRWNSNKRQFIFERHEIRRGPRLLQRAAAFPNSVRLSAGHPELFAARGSHGLWARPGRHRYARVPGLYDDTGYGSPWRTWEHVSVLVDSGLDRDRLGRVRLGRDGFDDWAAVSVDWMRFLGRWGNPRDGCHPLSSAICHRSDGPTGIPLKQRPFSCSRR